MAVLTAACLGLAACAAKPLFETKKVDRLEDAGEVHIAATFVADWDDYVAELGPGFSLTGDQAKSIAIAQTAAFERGVLDAFGVNVKAALPSVTESVSVTDTLNADGSTDRTGQASETRTSGDIDSTDGLAPTLDASTLQRNLIKPNPVTGAEVDPLLEYTAATALYQEVKLLNNYVKNAARRHDMVPYLMRIQVTLSPFARHQPYDHHITLSFFSEIRCDFENETHKEAFVRIETNEPTENELDLRKNLCQAEGGFFEDNAFVVPLVVTDNIERSLSTRTSNVIRQLALATSATQGGFSLGLGLNRKMEELNAILANDFNSLMTVGRPAPSSLYLRLGAMQEATAKYATVPRTYNATLLVMVPQDQEWGGPRNGDVERLRIAGSVVVRDSETGEALQEPSVEYRRDNVMQLVTKVAAQPTPKRPNRTTMISEERAEALLGSIFSNDYTRFTQILRGGATYSEYYCAKNTEAAREANSTAEAKEKNNTGVDKKDCARVWTVGSRRDLWNEIIESLGSSGFVGDTVDLPRKPEPQLPDKTQTAFLIDDGKTKSTITLVGGMALDRELLAAKMEYETVAGDTVVLPADAITLAAGGGNPVLSFRSLHAWKLTPKLETGSREMTKASLYLYYQKTSGTDEAQVPMAGGYYRPSPEGLRAQTAMSGTVHYISQADVPDPVLLSITRSATTITADAAGNGKIKVHVKLSKNTNTTVPSGASLSVDGADLQNAKTDAGTALSVSGNSVQLTGDDTVTLEVGNISKGGSFDVSGQGILAGKPVGAKHAKVAIKVN